MGVVVHHGDSREVLKSIPSNSVDSVVTDPPYALVSIVKRFGADDAAPAQEGASGVYSRASAGFMGQTWDTGETAFAVEFWAEVMRVLKPGGHVVAASGTRTYHRLAVAIEDAGFEIRDMISWLYGSGFPKSHDVSKGIDRRRDDKSEIIAVAKWLRPHVERVGFAAVTAHFGFKDETMARARWTSASQPNTPRWDQWVALKLLCGFGDEMDSEVWRLNGRKGTPGEAWGDREVIGQGESGISEAFGDGEWLSGKATFDITKSATPEAAEWEGWGTALKPACEPWVLARKPLQGTVAANVLAHGTGALNIDACRIATGENLNGGAYAEVGNRSVSGSLHAGSGMNVTGATASSAFVQPIGRWPANVIHDGSDEVVAAFPQTAIAGGYPASGAKFGLSGGERKQRGEALQIDMAGGSAARFFYTAKADAEDRVCECSVCGSLPIGPPHCLCRDPEDSTKKAKAGGHPTVKPIDLMQYLCRLVTPKGGTILDPFAGSGTTGTAARREGFNAILIEREERFAAFIRHRLTRHEEVDMFSL